MTAKRGACPPGGACRVPIVEAVGQSRPMLVCASADARIKRDQSANAAFKKQHPCPDTGAAKVLG